MFLFLYFLKSTEKRDLRQEEREAQYSRIINEFSKYLNTLSLMQKELAEIKELLLIKKGNTKYTDE